MPDEIGRRRSDRILAPVRIRVTGHDSSGVRFEEETLTACINKHGASISLSHSLRPEDRVRIENLATGTEGEFRVVGVSQQLFGSRREWGVEALHPKVNIWGVEFPSPSEGIQPKGLIQCKACRKVTLTPLSAIEYGVLLSQGQISRHCDGCDVTTRWQPSEEPAAAQVAQMAPKPGGSGDKERRSHRRIKLAMCLRVRNSRGEVEVVQTGDVSKSGLCFVSKRQYRIHEEVYLTLPFGEKQALVETKATVVRTHQSPEGRVYGVNYVAEV